MRIVDDRGHQLCALVGAGDLVDAFAHLPSIEAE